MNDKQIVDLFWQRSESAISETAGKYGKYCYTIAFNILESAQDSEECVNDTWLSAWNSMPDKRPEKLSPFLGKITRNFAISKALEKTRKKRGGGALPLALDELDDCVASGFSLEEELDARELERAMNAFVRSLPETERQVFVLRYWFLETEERIAKRQGFSRSKVGAMLKRIRNKLRNYLMQEGLCEIQKG